MALRDSTTLYYGSKRIYHTLLWFYVTLPHSTMVLRDSTTLYYGSTWLYHTLWLYVTTTLYYGSMSLYLTIPHSTMALCDSTTLHYGSMSLYSTIPHSIMALLDSVLRYCTLPWLYYIQLRKPKIKSHIIQQTISFPSAHLGKRKRCLMTSNLLGLASGSGSGSGNDFTSWLSALVRNWRVWHHLI